MTNSLVLDYLLPMLVEHEGLRLKPYKDTRGKLTIGIGRNLDDKGISKEEALVMCVSDMEEVAELAETKLPFYSVLNSPRKCVILSMMFNMGFEGFSKFKKFIQLVNVRDFDSASREMLNSLWSTQVPNRAKELAEIMRTGEFPRKYEVMQ